MTVLKHAAAESFVSKNSGLPIARILSQETGAAACELWEQPLAPGDLIPMHWHLVEEVLTFHSGRVTVTLDGTDHVIDADRDGPCTVLVPARIHHAIRNSGDAPTRMLAFFPSLLPKIFPVAAGQGQGQG